MLVQDTYWQTSGSSQPATNGVQHRSHVQALSSKVVFRAYSFEAILLLLLCVANQHKIFENSKQDSGCWQALHTLVLLVDHVDHVEVM